MAVDVKTEVAGLKEALRELNKVDRSLRLQITKDYKKIVEPVLWDIQRHVPVQPPMSGWKGPYRKGSPGPLWSPKEPANIKPFISGSRERHWGPFTSNLGVFGIRWRGGASTLFDQARDYHTKQGKSMIDTLNDRFPAPRSRAMYRDYERHVSMVEAQLKQLVALIMERMNRAI